MGRKYRRAQYALLTLVLASCGGGGSDAPSAGQAGPSVSANVTSIDVSKTVADPSTPIGVRVTVSSLPATDLWGGLEYGGAAISSVGWEALSSSVVLLSVHLRVYGDTVPGNYAGDLAFHVCEDQACSKPLRGSPIRIPVTLAVTGVPRMAITVDPARIDVVAVRGAAGFQTVGTTTLNLGAPIPVDTVPYFSETHSEQFIEGFSLARPSSTTIELSVILQSPDVVSPGTHSDVVSLDLCYASGCVNRVIDTPFAIPVTYVVRPEPAEAEPGVAPLVPTWTSALPHDVVDAEYSDALEAVVIVSSYPSSSLYVYDVNTRTEEALALDRLPTSVSVGPDGLAAAVGHDRLVSYVDLTTLDGPGATPATLLDLSTEAHDIVLDGRGYVHVLPVFESPIDIRSIEIATNTEHLAAGTVFYSTRARLHASGDYLYAVTDNVSPSDLQKFDIRSVPIDRLYDSRYHGDYEMCGDLWVGESGQRVFSACGHAFQAAELEADDLIYDGTLTLSSVPPVSAYVIRSLSTADSHDEVALLEEEFFDCTQGHTPARCFPHLALYDGSYQRLRLYALAPVLIDGFPYGQRGLFVFHSSDGSRKFMLHKLYGTPSPQTEFYVSEL